jgi:2,4-diketo-3-deoxy-L-fuconate hydrolase
MQFKLGIFSRAGAAPFIGLVDHTAARVVPLALVEPLLERLNLKLRHHAGLGGQGESLLSLLSDWDSNFQALAILCESFSAELTQRSVAVDDLRIRAPIDPPRQVFCTIANYRSHIIETILDAGVPPHTDGMDAAARQQYAERNIEERLRGAPYACFKLPSTVIGPTDSLQIPRHAQRVDWELELGVVIGKPARRVSRSEAMSHVAGYVLVNDITARDQVRRADVPNMGTGLASVEERSRLSAPGTLLRSGGLSTRSIQRATHAFPQQPADAGWSRLGHVVRHRHPDRIHLAARTTSAG